MVGNQSGGGGVITISIIVAIILMLIPLSDSVRFFRPEWVVMALIYWAMALPRRVGVGFSWFVGLVMDLIMGGTLGIYAFAYALVVYLILMFHLQLRQYPLWQQGLSILSLVLLVQIISVLFSSKISSWTIFLPALMSTIMWPVVFAVLRKVRRSFQVN